MKRGEEDFPGRGQHVQRPCVQRDREETVSREHAAGRGRGRSALRSAREAARVPAARSDSTSCDGAIAGLWANLYSRRWPCVGTGR